MILPLKKRRPNNRGCQKCDRDGDTGVELEVEKSPQSSGVSRLHLALIPPCGAVEHDEFVAVELVSGLTVFGKIFWTGPQQRGHCSLE